MKLVTTKVTCDLCGKDTRDFQPQPSSGIPIAYTFTKHQYYQPSYTIDICVDCYDIIFRAIQHVKKSANHS